MKPAPGAELHFALLFALIFAIIALYPLISGQSLRVWAVIIAVTFLALGFLKPAILSPLNYLWFKLGLLLHAVVSPVVMALLYYGTVFPTNLLLRLSGKDPMQRKFNSTSDSYWIARNPPGPEHESFKNQF